MGSHYKLLGKKLLTDQIRLIYILPSTAQASAGDPTVRCKVITTTLDNAGEYYALSYVWGNSDFTSEICLNDKPFPVTRNLKHALQNLRDIIGDLPVWIDALCINQASVLEKNEQVRRMKLIYSRAKRVIAWLGSATDGCDQAIDRFDEIGEMLLAHTSVAEFVLGKTENSLEVQLRHSPLLGYSLDALFPFDQTLALLNRPFWQRVWITQELYLAKSIIFACGQRSACWKRFFVAYYFLHANCKQPHELLKEQHQIPWNLMEKALSVSSFVILGSFLHKIANKPMPLNTILLTMQGRMHASDPRDLVYGVLGIASDTTELKVDVDYRKEIVDVYKNVTRSLILQGDLDIISNSQEPLGVRHSGLPSWVPDFSKPIAVEPIVKGFSEEPEYSASGSTIVDAKFKRSTSSTALLVSGISIGEICGFGRPWNKDLGCSLTAINDWFEDMYSLQKRHKVKHKPNESLWATPIARTEANESEPEILKRHEIRYSAYLELRKASGQLSDGEPTSAEILERAAPYLYSMNMTAHKRRVFVVSGYLGLGPESMEVGDVVCIFSGAKVPYVLRKRQNRSYMLVGDAYVFGVMFGERKWSPDSEQVFEIS